MRRLVLLLILSCAGPVLGQDRGPSGAEGNQRPNVPLPDESAGFDQVVQSLVSAFDHTDILGISEYHRRKLDSDLRIRLIRHPDFAKKVHFIVVEFASTAEQPVLDRYIRGEDVPPAELQQVWRNTSQTSGVWESPVYAEFFAAVRDINAKLPAENRIRVLAGDPPPGGARMESVISVLTEQILDKQRKALLIYGLSHLQRAGAGVGGITKSLQSKYPGRLFVVDVLGGPSPEYQKFDSALKSPARPVLVSLERMPFRDFSAHEFLGNTNKMQVDGVWVPAPVYLGLTLGQIADACVYLGMSPDVEKSVSPVP